MKYIKISLFLGIIIFSGFFAKTTSANDFCANICDRTPDGNYCVTVSDDDPELKATTIQDYNCKQVTPGPCPASCPDVNVCLYACSQTTNGKTCITSGINSPEIVNVLKTNNSCLYTQPGACPTSCPEEAPPATSLANNCACTFVFDGKGCSINKEKIFPFGTGGGSSVLLRDMVDSASFAKCPKEAFTSNFVDLDYSVNATEENCSNVHYRVANLAGYISELDCAVKDEASNAISGTGLSSDIKTWIQFGEVIHSSTAGTSDTGTKPQTVSLVNPLGTTDLIAIFGKLIKAFVGLVGMIVLVVFVYGGFMWLLSAGNPEKIKKGTQAMMYALIGLFIIFSAYVIISTILKALI